MSAPRTEEIARMIDGGRNLVPPHMWGGIERYYLRGIAPGDFLYAVLCNDLMGAYGRADDINSANMRNWVMFLYNFTPSGSSGSPENVKAWLDQFVEQEAA